MGFSQLKQKVTQAEKSLEAHERVVASDWRVLKDTWRDAWTPGRIVIAGLASGFVMGKIEPVSRSKASSILNMFTAVGGLFASGTAAGAAEDAKDAAARVENEVPTQSDIDSTHAVPTISEESMRVQTVETLRKAGLL